MPHLNRTVALLAAGALALTGCSALSPNTTQFDYSAPDGTQVTVNGVFAHNLMLAASVEGGPAMLVGSLTNRTADDATVTITWDGGEAEVAVGGNQTVIMGGGASHEYVSGTSPVIPGLIANITFTTDTGASETAPVPVMDGTLPEYGVFDLLDVAPE